MDKIKDIISDAFLDGTGYTGNLVRDIQKHYVLSELLGIPISGYSSFTMKNKFYRDRLLNINIAQKEQIIQNLGDGIIEDFGQAGDMNYNKEFALLNDYNESFNYNTTRGIVSDGNSYTTNNPLDGTVPGSIYNGITNFYYDDNGTGSFSNKILTSSVDSILDKTKYLFNKQKIKTIISRFHTDNDINKAGDSTSSYGMSHGRNLLKKDAEDGNSKGSNFNVNGYSNPYCRVWTHHYQYDNISKLIRPFTDENGSFYSISQLQGDWSFIRPKGSVDRLEKYGKLNKNGFVNIAPSYDTDENFKIDTKSCMFSIENLAWKGYDPYSFEKALSWEQRGPMGGRIMWFPPYNLSFQENVNVQWNSDSFIGRGENVYSYANTERSGTLTFQMIVDHPSIINYYEGNAIYKQVEKTDNVNGNNLNYQMSGVGGMSSNLNNLKIDINDIKATIPSSNNGLESSPIYENVDTGLKDSKRDTDLLRFFAGCNTIDGTHKNLTDEFQKTSNSSVKENKIIVKPTPVVDDSVPNKVGMFTFYVFYPNNYSGINDNVSSNVSAIAYLINGSVAQKHGEEDIPISSDDFYNHASLNGIGTGYETVSTNGISEYMPDYEFNDMSITGITPEKYIWNYRIDGSYDLPSNNANNFYDQKLKYSKNYSDNTSFGLNGNHEKVKDTFGIDSNDLYSLAEVAYVLTDNEDAKNIIKNKMNYSSDRITLLTDIIENSKITSVSIVSFSNSHGNNSSSNINATRNENLASNRGKTIGKWLKSKSYFSDSNLEFEYNFNSSEKINTDDISSLEAKKYRSARVVVSYEMSSSKRLSETKQEYVNDNGITVEPIQEYVGYNSKVDENGNIVYIDENGKQWKKDENGNLYLIEYEEEKQQDIIVNVEDSFNDIRYDQEYRFFTVLKEKNPIIYNRLIDKIKYFDPAFHSMTPEGFNGRLNFLQQCTRQGNTIGASDKNYKTATNLAFGRPPICILRIGDFYNTEIVITNLTVDYDPLVWDLNSEGIGVQPLLANVNISFNFIGGSSLSGPIKRLQNAMTFNYYANTEVYDNRSDTVEYVDNKEHTGNSQQKSYNAYITKQAEGDNN